MGEWEHRSVGSDVLRSDYIKDNKESKETRVEALERNQDMKRELREAAADDPVGGWTHSGSGDTITSTYYDSASYAATVEYHHGLEDAGRIISAGRLDASDQKLAESKANYEAALADAERASEERNKFFESIRFDEIAFGVNSDSKPIPEGALRYNDLSPEAQAELIKAPGYDANLYANADYTASGYDANQYANADYTAPGYNPNLYAQGTDLKVSDSVYNPYEAAGFTVPDFGSRLWEQNPAGIMPYVNSYLNDARALNGIVAQRGFGDTLKAEIASRGLNELPAAPESGNIEKNDSGGDFLDYVPFGGVLRDAVDGIIGSIKDLLGIEDLEGQDTYADKAAEALGDVFTPELIQSWPYMTMEGRINALDIFARHLGTAEGVGITGISVGDLQGAAGMNNGDGILILDYRDIQNPEQLGEVLDTILHEARHEFQREAIANPEKFDIPQETLDEWAANFKDYISPEEDPKGYMNQIIEVDARSAAAAALEKFASEAQQYESADAIADASPVSSVSAAMQGAPAFKAASDSEADIKHRERMVEMDVNLNLSDATLERDLRELERQKEKTK